MDPRESTTKEEQEVWFHFPLEANAGLAMQWTPALTTSLDLGFTDGSGWIFESERTGKVNPVDGSPHDTSPLADAWTLRLGTEYLFQGGKHPIPVRVGLLREELPAANEARVMRGLSVGTGYPLSLGRHRFWVDAAYSLRWSEDSAKLIPDLPELESKSMESWFVLSAILHF